MREFNRSLVLTENKMIKKIIRNLASFVFVMTLLFITNNDSFAQQPRGRTVNGAILNYYRSTGEILTVIAPYVFDEDFNRAVLDSNMYDENGVNSGAITFPDSVFGKAIFTTGAADNDDLVLGTELSKISGNGSYGFEITLRMRDVSGTSFFVGLADSATYDQADSVAFGVNGTTVVKMGNVAEAVGFVYDPDATTDNVFGINATGSVSGSLISSGTTANNTIPTDNSLVRVRLEVDANRKAFFYVNNQSLGQTTTVTTAAAQLYPYIGVINREGSANEVVVERMIYWSKR